MGYPSKSLEAFYRNPMSDVEKFLDSRHEGAYKVYNLCSERSYSDQRFQGRVAQFPFPDHSPPPFQLIHPFCEDVSDWLHTTPGNVVAVHCKAGKGRTGVMLCAFLVHCGATADEAIKVYGEKRTMDGCGVTIPSQLRYIRYYEQFLESRTLNYDPRLLVLQELIIDTIPKPLQNLEPGSNYLILTIMSSDVKIYESMPQHCYVDPVLQRIRISITDKVVLAGDVKMMLWYDSLYKRSHLCHFYFNTTFIQKTEDAICMRKPEIDKACKDKLHSTFDKDFGICVRFSPALAQQSPLPTLDSLPNRAILLKYKNHLGPNSVQISPPYFSSVRLSPPRNNSAMSAFSLAGLLGTTPPSSPANTGESTQSESSSLPKSSESSSTSIATNGTAMRSPILVQSKSAFKPMWSDKDRDRDDNWDTASVSSDCSESDANLEWWYTMPPRPTLHSSAGAAVTTASASLVQPETSIRTDPEMRVLIHNDKKDRAVDEMPPSPSSMQSNGSGGLSYRPVLSNICSIVGAGCSSIASSPPSSAYKSPPHSATSPLAHEIKFETETSPMERVKYGNCCKSEDESTVESGDRHDREIDERGWVDSMSRWLWFNDGKPEVETSGS
ncbi:hypothetical protein BG011_007396 [Mortierella polycephala]|uniref:Phosphatidylinositol 3,4,5-trisphosphate 3-phosphatase and dual-specificity protein phosphatase PTEN n=1 Tax=Mortierella polycephala TaxID=41804 RepID=A0A9P6TYN7_9FUNG|nr:hypothetical protein BG011_007396 [Mortierella polycephala]